MNVLGQRLDDACYYRSSLCSTPEGRPLCAAMEARYLLEPVSTATLPARPSMPDVVYEGESVEIGLYRARGLRR